MMKEVNGDQETDEKGGELLHVSRVESYSVPNARIMAVAKAIIRYHDNYPVLQRGVLLLCQELCTVNSSDGTTTISQDIQSLIGTKALINIVKAMDTYIESPSFVSSCFELLVLLENYRSEDLTSILWKTDILTILDKIVHSAVYQHEPACVQRGMYFSSKLLRHLNSIEIEMWLQLVSTAAQAMLINSVNTNLGLECLMNLQQLFQLKPDAGIPIASASTILKSLEQCNQHPGDVSNEFVSASVAVVFRIFDAHSGALRTSYVELFAPTLSLMLHHYQLKLNPHDVLLQFETLICQSLHHTVQTTLVSLVHVTSPSAKAKTSTEELHSAAAKLLLGAVWREEARAFLDCGGVTVLTNVLTSRVELGIKRMLAQTLYYVSMHWPDETWNEIKLSRTGVHMWILQIRDRCEAKDDASAHYLLGMVKTLLQCKEFREEFRKYNGVKLFQLVLDKCQLLPLGTRSVVSILTLQPEICPTALLPALCCSVADVMLSQECNDLECVKALASILRDHPENEAILSNQRVRDIVRGMKSRLGDKVFITEVLNFVVIALTLKNIRAAIIDQGILQVVSMALCTHQWNPAECAGSNARWILAEVAHKMDVTKNLNILMPGDQDGHIMKKMPTDHTATSTETVTVCCSVIGALAHVKPFAFLLLQQNGICCLVKVLRQAKQELVIRSEGSFLQLVSTCLYSLSNILNVPTVTQGMETISTDVPCRGIDERLISSQLIETGADDVIIGCLEESLRAKQILPLLVDRGCELLQSVLTYISLSSEVECRWLALVTSILRNESPPQKTRELLFTTTLMVLSQDKQSYDRPRWQHVNFMKVVVERLDSSINDEKKCINSCSQFECIGAVRILENIAKASNSLSDYFISRCLCVLRKLMSSMMLSLSPSAGENLERFNHTIALFATPGYVERLVCRLKRYTAKRREITAMAKMTDDFEALKALLYSSQGKKRIDMRHQQFRHLAAVIEHFDAYVQSLGDHAPFFLELGCLTSQFLPTAQRNKVINDALCYFAENTTWHSMRWIAAFTDWGPTVCTLIVEFVLLRITSGYMFFEQTLLMEYLHALNFLLNCRQCREKVLASSHIKQLQYVLWLLVSVTIVKLDAEVEIAVPLLGIVSSLISSPSKDIFSIDFVEKGSEQLICLCLGALDTFVPETTFELTKVLMREELLRSTSLILQHCIHLSAESTEFIFQHQATPKVLNYSMCAAASTSKKLRENWSLGILESVFQSHGLLFANKLLHKSSNPSTFLIGLINVAPRGADTLPWKTFVELSTVEWHNTCGVFVDLYDKSEGLRSGQISLKALAMKTYITETLERLKFLYGQHTLDMSSGEMTLSLEEIVRSGLAFYELFAESPNFNGYEYSSLVSLHLKFARLAVLKSDTERKRELTESIRQLLNPRCISDEALADFLELAMVVYLSPSMEVWLFIRATTNVMSRSMQRLKYELVRSVCLEKSLRNCFASLEVVYTTKWSSEEARSVLELLSICSPDKTSQGSLLKSVLVLPDGPVRLFELARTALCKNTHMIIITYLFQHAHDICHRMQRVSEIELVTITSTINQILEGKDGGDLSKQKWRKLTMNKILCDAFKMLWLFARRRNCALLCSDLGGTNILYDMLCAPSQYEDSIQTVLEICCCLDDYGADLRHQNLVLALQLLFVFAETNIDPSYSRLAFLVFRFSLAVDVSALSLPMIQQCRTQIIPVFTRSQKETTRFAQQLYIVRQKAPCMPPSDENAIKDVFLSLCKSIELKTNGDGVSCYANGIVAETGVFDAFNSIQLHKAIDQLRLVLNGPDKVISDVSALVPALSKLLVFPTIATTTRCWIMQVLEQIVFVDPFIVLFNEEVDVPALFASCAQLQHSSLPFARLLCLFCSSIGAGLRATADDKVGLSVSLVSLLLDLLQTWKSDLEVVDLVLLTVCEQIDALSSAQFEHLRCGDILALFNSTIIHSTDKCLTCWNWLKSVLAIINKVDQLESESGRETINTVITIIRLFMGHSFMVEKALVVLLQIFKENQQLPLRHLVEADGAGILLECLKQYIDKETIIRSCLVIMEALTLLTETDHKAVDQLVETDAAALILLVSKEHSDKSFLCELCIRLIDQMVESFEKSPEQGQVMMLRKKSELMTQLLEADILSFLFELTDTYSNQGNNRILETLLLFIKTLTKENSIRESFTILQGVVFFQQIIDQIWAAKLHRATIIIELAIDCLVTMACFDKVASNDWRMLPMWLLELADSLQSQTKHSTGMCVEKLTRILRRLTAERTICKSILPKGLFIILKQLVGVRNDSSLEEALLGLLSSLCEDAACIQILMIYGVVPIIAERIICRLHDSNILLANLWFFDAIMVNSKDIHHVLLDESVFAALNLVLQTYPKDTEGQVYRIAHTLLEKVSASYFLSAYALTKPAKLIEPQAWILESEKSLCNMLLEGAKFRALWKGRFDTIESIQLKLAPSREYLLFRRNGSAQLSQIERIFVSQIEVCSQRSLIDVSGSFTPPKKLLKLTFLEKKIEGDRVLNLKIRGECVLIKAASIRERVYWEQALQWLVSQHQTCCIPSHSSSQSLIP